MAQSESDEQPDSPRKEDKTEVSVLSPLFSPQYYPLFIIKSYFIFIGLIFIQNLLIIRNRTPSKTTRAWTVSSTRASPEISETARRSLPPLLPRHLPRTPMQTPIQISNYRIMLKILRKAAKFRTTRPWSLPPLRGRCAPPRAPATSGSLSLPLSHPIFGNLLSLWYILLNLILKF